MCSTLHSNTKNQSYCEILKNILFFFRALFHFANNFEVSQSLETNDVLKKKLNFFLHLI